MVLSARRWEPCGGRTGTAATAEALRFVLTGAGGDQFLELLRRSEAAARDLSNHTSRSQLV